MTHSKKYFHIGLHFVGTTLSKELEPTFTKYADDWIRYAENCWIVYTKHNSKDWLIALKPYLGEKDQLLILEITQDQKLSGWLPNWIWDWLYKKRS